MGCIVIVVGLFLTHSFIGPTALSIQCPECCKCKTITSVRCADGWDKTTIGGISNTTRELLLEGGRVSKLDGDFFRHLIALESLKLIDTSIREIEPGTLNGKPHLTRLVLMNTMIMQIVPGTFDGLLNLKELILYNTSLTEITPETFRCLPHLIVLNLMCNNISIIPSGTFGCLPRLTFLNLALNNIVEIADGAFGSLHQLAQLFMWQNKIKRIGPGTFQDLHNLTHLYMQNNTLMQIVPDTFVGLNNLQLLHLGSNFISSISNGSFNGLNNLQHLFLIKNSNTEIAVGAFRGLTELTFLDISFSEITSFNASCFSGLGNLRILVANVTPLEVIQSKAFNGLRSLQKMVLTMGKKSSSAQPIQVEDGALNDLVNLTELVVDDVRTCCKFVSAIEAFTLRNCKVVGLSEKNIAIQCGSLIQSRALSVFMWMIGLTAVLGNLMVIVWRRRQGGKTRHESRTHTFMVCNLALSDLIMGIFMLIIATADAIFGETYSDFAEEWISSAVCKIAGLLAVVSSEASVFFVTLIGVECFLLIVVPYSHVKLEGNTSKIIVFFIWAVAACLSVITIVVGDSEANVYGVSAMCIGLPFLVRTVGSKKYLNDTEWDVSERYNSIPDDSKQAPAWTYSSVLFIGVNMLCFMILLCCYIAIFVSVKRSARKVMKTARRKNEIKMAVKMALIVGTDFACWMPVIIMGILSQTQTVKISDELYAWTVVFILPINSSLNPLMYTFYSRMMARKNKPTST